jgi:hypothetical protein
MLRQKGQHPMPAKPTTDDVNLYINWILNAIYGRLADADAIMQTARPGIQRVATMLQARWPIVERPLYRGMLLHPSCKLDTEPSYSFVSWSEDRDVARWFGSPEAFISEPFTLRYPEARGYVLTLEQPTNVLFHYSWAGVFGTPLPTMALMHPFMGAEGARQIDWSLRTQQEVITAPLPTLPAAKPVEDIPGAVMAELDRRLAPPWTLNS